jgi:hypothetical protein
MKNATGTNGSVRDLTEEEDRALFDNAARFYLGISGEEFVERWDSGYYDEDPDHPDVVDVVMLLPFAR